LQAKAEENEYHRMVRNVADTPEKYNLHADVREVREDSRKITGIVNILFTIVGVFGGVFYLSSHVFSSLGWVTCKPRFRLLPPSLTLLFFSSSLLLFFYGWAWFCCCCCVPLPFLTESSLHPLLDLCGRLCRKLALCEIRSFVRKEMIFSKAWLVLISSQVFS